MGLWGSVDDVVWTVAGRAVQLVEWDRTHRYCGRCATPTERGRRRAGPAVPGVRAARLPPPGTGDDRPRHRATTAARRCSPAGRASRSRCGRASPASSSPARRSRRPCTARCARRSASRSTTSATGAASRGRSRTRSCSASPRRGPAARSRPTRSRSPRPAGTGATSCRRSRPGCRIARRMIDAWVDGELTGGLDRGFQAGVAGAPARGVGVAGDRHVRRAGPPRAPRAGGRDPGGRAGVVGRRRRAAAVRYRSSTSSSAPPCSSPTGTCYESAATPQTFGGAWPLGGRDRRRAWRGARSAAPRGGAVLGVPGGRAPATARRRSRSSRAACCTSLAGAVAGDVAAPAAAGRVRGRRRPRPRGGGPHPARRRAPDAGRRAAARRRPGAGAASPATRSASCGSGCSARHRPAPPADLRGRPCGRRRPGSRRPHGVRADGGRGRRRAGAGGPARGGASPAPSARR